jgi:hypothetical protein
MWDEDSSIHRCKKWGRIPVGQLDEDKKLMTDYFPLCFIHEECWLLEVRTCFLLEEAVVFYSQFLYASAG